MMRIISKGEPAAAETVGVSFSDPLVGGPAVVEGQRQTLLDVLATPTRIPGKARKDYKRSQHHVSPRCSRRRLAGVRQVRRCENLAYLLAQATDRDNDESGEVDFVDLVSSSKNSVFAELFLAEEKMSIWNEFVNCSEDEQQRILERGVRTGENKLESDDDYEVLSVTDMSLDGTKVRTEGDGTDTMTDRIMDDAARETRLAKSAHHCFSRINHNLRCFLRRSHFPHGELLGLEAELVAFFSDWPTSVYVAQLSDGFRRLLLHAVSQYLDLHSASFDSPEGGDGVKGCRQTQVENRVGNGSFTPPKVSLADFLNDTKVARMNASGAKNIGKAEK